MAVTTGTATMYAGNKLALAFTVTDENGGGAKDLSGFSVFWALSRFKADGTTPRTTAVLEKSTASGIAISGASSNVATVSLASADTTSLKPGAYYYELEVVDGLSERVVVATGTLTINPNVVNS